MDLDSKHCVPCEGGVVALTGDSLKPYLTKIQGWSVIEEHHIVKTFTFRDFISALDFVNRVGRIAEGEGHHPDIYLTWGKVEIKIFTHAIKGLSENDFILAAKIDKLVAS